MNKREIVAPLLVIGLTVLFAGVCVMVFVSNGKSAKWISRKMLIGSLLLSLGSYTNMISQERIISCYDVDLELLQKQKTKFTITKIDNKKIRASITNKSFTLSYRLIDEQNNIKDFGRISEFYASEDQRFNFNIFIKSCVKAGKYKLLLYKLPLEEQTNSNFSVITDITIKDE